MVTFFDWKKIIRAGGRSSNTILRILKIIAYKPQPRGLWDYDYRLKIKDYSGKSFLVNLHGLLEKAYQNKPKDVAEYVALASLRSYAHYAATKDTTLELLHSPVSEDIINNNRLLSIKDGRIHFRYEEVTRRK